MHKKRIKLYAKCKHPLLPMSQSTPMAPIDNGHMTINTPSDVVEQPQKKFRARANKMGRFGNTTNSTSGGFDFASVDGTVLDVRPVFGNFNSEEVVWFFELLIDVQNVSGGKPDEKFVFAINLYPDNPKPENCIYVTRPCQKNKPVSNDKETSTVVADKKSDVSEDKVLWHPRTHQSDTPMAQFSRLMKVKINAQSNIENMMALGLVCQSTQRVDNRAKLLYIVSIAGNDRIRNVCLDFSPLIGKTVHCTKFEPVATKSIITIDNSDMTRSLAFQEEEETEKIVYRVTNESKSISLLDSKPPNCSNNNDPLHTVFLKLDPTPPIESDELESEQVDTDSPSKDEDVVKKEQMNDAIYKENLRVLNNTKAQFLSSFAKAIDQTHYNKHHQLAEVQDADGTALKPIPQAKAKWNMFVQQLQNPKLDLDDKIDLIKKEVSVNQSFSYDTCIHTGMERFHEQRAFIQKLIENNDPKCAEVFNMFIPINKMEFGETNKDKDHLVLKLVHSAIIPNTIVHMLQNSTFSELPFEKQIDKVTMSTPESVDTPEDQTSCSTVCVPLKPVHEQLGRPPFNTLKYLLTFLDIGQVKLMTTIKPNASNVFNSLNADMTFNFYDIICLFCNPKSVLYTPDPLLGSLRPADGVDNYLNRFHYYTSNGIIDAAHMFVPVSNGLLVELGVLSCSEGEYNCKIRFTEDAESTPVPEYDPSSHYKKGAVANKDTNPQKGHQIKNANFANSNNKVTFSGFKKKKFAPIHTNYQSMATDAQEMNGNLHLAILFVSKEAQDAASDFVETYERESFNTGHESTHMKLPYAWYKDDEVKSLINHVKTETKCSKVLDLFKDATHTLLYGYFMPGESDDDSNSAKGDDQDDVHNSHLMDTEEVNHDKPSKPKVGKRKKTA